MPDSSVPSASPLARFVQKVSAKVEDLTTLTITTAVGSVEWKADDGGSTVTANARAIVSEINLVDGDVTTQLDDAFVTGDYQELRQFHAAREEQGHQIIQNNLAALKELLSFVKDLDSNS